MRTLVAFVDLPIADAYAYVQKFISGLFSDAVTFEL